MTSEQETNSEERSQYIAIWTKAVETQMHFNEMSVKSRQLGLTFVAAALGLGVVLLIQGEDSSFAIELGPIKFQINIALLLLASSALGLRAVRQLDLNVYHKMLRGAVTFGEDFEENYMKKVFDLEKGMTQAISHFSRHSDASAKVQEGMTKYKYFGASKVTASDKIAAFYNHASKFLWTAVLILFLITNVPYWNQVYGENRNQAAERAAVEPTVEGGTAQRATVPSPPGPSSDRARPLATVPEQVVSGEKTDAPTTDSEQPSK